MKYHLTRSTSNRKLVGPDDPPVATSTISAESCPVSCPLVKNGCYGDGGPQALHWRKVTEGERGTDFEQFLDDVANLPKDQLFRHGVTGDTTGTGDEINVIQLLRLASVASFHTPALRGWAYTHKPPSIPANRDAIAAANRPGFALNLSGNNPAHADELADYGIAPVVTVLPADQFEDTVTPAGRRIKVCPATLPDSDATCASCKLCLISDPKRVIIGFPAHGASKRRAERATSNA